MLLSKEISTLSYTDLDCLLESVQLLHKNGIVHGDIKPTNLALHNNKLAILDFDYSSPIGT